MPPSQVALQTDQASGVESLFLLGTLDHAHQGTEILGPCSPHREAAVCLGRIKRTRRSAGSSAMPRCHRARGASCHWGFSHHRIASPAGRSVQTDQTNHLLRAGSADPCLVSFRLPRHHAPLPRPNLSTRLNPLQMSKCNLPCNGPVATLQTVACACARGPLRPPW